MKFELSNVYQEWLEKMIEQNESLAIQQSLQDIYPADISSVLYEFNAEKSKYVLDLLKKEVSAEIISNLEEDVRKKFLKNFSSTEIASYLDYVDSDDAADILNEQPVLVREEVIAHMTDQEKASHIVDLLRYDEDCAGGLMAKELMVANVNWTVVQCIEEIRRQAEKVEKIYSVYVVNDQGFLLGRVSLKKIILASDQMKIADIYDPDVISVETYRKDDEVAAIMRKYDLEAIPVVNVQRKLLGRITIDDIVDVIAEQAEQDRQLMSGISENVEEHDSVWTVTRSRLPWLIIGMVGGMLGASFIGLFEKDLIIIPAMAFFIPLITATGGNVGIQSSSMVLQTLANKTSLGNGFYERFIKMLLVALVNGVVISALVFIINFIFGQSPQLAIVVSISLFSVVLLSSFMGTFTPIVLNKIKINPALASGPFITTANDIIGLAVYFGTSRLLHSIF